MFPRTLLTTLVASAILTTVTTAQSIALSSDIIKSKSDLSTAQQETLRSALQGPLSRLNDSDAATVMAARRDLVKLARTRDASVVFRMQLAREALPSIEKTTASGTPFQSVNAIAVAGAIRTSDAAEAISKLLSPAAQSCAAVRLAAAGELAANMTAMELTDAQAASVSRAIAKAASDEVEPLILADELSALSTLLDLKGEQTRRNESVLAATSQVLTAVSERMSKDVDKAKVADGLLVGLQQLRRKTSRAPSGFLRSCGQALGASLQKVESAANIPPADGSSELKETFAQLSKLTQSMRTLLFNPGAAAPKKTTPARPTT
ncbi:MAG: hypothetical protein O2800_03435 [Planctomycetota bacterium]|nr:hypothetical protein [Planctomycetota bacterium]